MHQDIDKQYNHNYARLIGRLVQHFINMNLGIAYHGESSFRNNNFLTTIRYLLILVVCTGALGSIQRSTVPATCMAADPIALLAQ